MNACPSCGAANATGATQCTICGGALTPQAAPAQAGAFGAQPPQGGFGSPPPQGGFGAQPPQGGFGAQPPQGGFGAQPPQGGFGAQPPQGGFGVAAPSSVAAGTLDVGAVLSSSFELQKKVASTTLPALIACALPGAIGSGVGSVMQTSGIASGDASAVFGVGLLVVLASAFLSVVLGQIGAGAASYAALEARAQRAVPSVGQAVSIALPRIGSVLLALFLNGLAVLFGTILCVIPGIIAAVALCLVMPVIMAERVPAMDALSRSAALTDGVRMDVFLVLFVAGLCMVGAMIPLMCCVGAVGGAAAVGGGGTSMAAVFVNQFASTLVGAVVGSFMQCVLVELYARRSGWGARPDATEVAQVFG